MIESREQWQASKGFLTEDVRRTIEALRDVARAAKRQEKMSPGTLSSNTMNALARIEKQAPWLLEEEHDGET